MINYKISSLSSYNLGRKGQFHYIGRRTPPKFYFHICYYLLKFKLWLFPDYQPNDFIIKSFRIQNDKVQLGTLHCMLCGHESILRDLGFIKNCKSTCPNYGMSIESISGSFLMTIPQDGNRTVTMDL